MWKLRFHKKGSFRSAKAMVVNMILKNEKLKEKLREIAENIISRCTFPTETSYGHAKLLLPAGDNHYPAFWIRDCAMMMQTGLVPPAVMRQAIETTSRFGQNGPSVLCLKNGLTVPAWTAADHVNHDGRPVFFPGTYESGENQGDGSYGFYPPIDDSAFYIMMVGSYVSVTGDTGILTEEFSGIPLAERLEHAWNAIPRDPVTGLCKTDDPAYAVDFGFHDTVRKSGLLLAPSIQCRMAAETLSQLFEKSGDAERAGMYRRAKERLDAAITETFYDADSGWFWSATGIGHQHDVWGSAVAAYLGILNEEQLKKTAETFYRAYRTGTAVYRGYVRQIPSDENFSETTMWECSTSPIEHYQNGAYWSTPTGCYASVLAEYDIAAAEEMLYAFIAHTEAHQDEGAPWEWMNRTETDIGARVYGTSASGPYAAVQMLVY